MCGNHTGADWKGMGSWAGQGRCVVGKNGWRVEESGRKGREGKREREKEE